MSRMIEKRWVAFLMLPVLIVASVPVSAQTVTRPGITVTGTGDVRRPADAVRYTIVLAARGNATSTTIFAAADALVAALKRNGGADAVVADPLNSMLNQQSVVTVRGSIRKPTLESVRALFAGVTAALPPDGVPIQQITYVNVLDDCSDAERIAQAAALADARARASGIAAAAHLTLGGVVAASQLGGQPSGACPTKPDAIVPQNGFNPSQSPDAFSVTVGVTLNVTFAIEGS
jgi:uncharacterized protein YggE